MRYAFLLALPLLWAPHALSQEGDVLLSASHVIVPQVRSYIVRPRPHGSVRITGVSAKVELKEQAAITTLEIALHNPNRRQAEAVLVLPVPDGAAVHAFAYDGPAAEPTARILRRDEARRTYDSIVRRSQDPALLEFAGYNLVRSSVFPVPAGGNQKVRITYSHIATVDGDRVDYVLPRSESLDVKVPWRIAVDIRSERKIATVYSPSHEFTQTRHNDTRVTLDVKHTDPGPFRISYLVKRNGVNATLFAYPDPKIGGGYFLMLAGGPAHAPRKVNREVTLVIDRSGSMAGPKMDQVRAAALQVIEGLADGESFNIIDYATSVERFATKPVTKTRETVLKAREYLKSLRPTGGTNIHDALVEALNQPRSADSVLPLVLFLTDGLPTIGNTSEIAIREAVKKGNPFKRRVFTFGVGNDVNVPLLDRIAEITRAAPEYVAPNEDVEVKVARVFKRLYGPVLASPRIEALQAAKVLTAGGREVDGHHPRFFEQMPKELADLFEGDQLVVLGKYRGREPIPVTLEGAYLGQLKRFKFEFKLDTATTRNAFVPRLWASRRIAFLVDQIRQAGATEGPAVQGRTVFSDPRYKEIADEILRLSTEWGILTEYTSFLAREGTNLNDWRALASVTSYELNERAVRVRSGLWAVTQGKNNGLGKKASRVDRLNRYLSRDDQSIQIVGGVQQCADRALFKRGSQWIEGGLVAGQKLAPDSTVAYGTPEYRVVLDKLIKQGRQGVIARTGDILLRLDGKNVLVQNRFPSPEPKGK
ncbi:MAG: VIT domain-containing protein [Planctomycetota bacterium]|jgi:Ca-activated chloride channel family protein